MAGITAILPGENTTQWGDFNLTTRKPRKWVSFRMPKKTMKGDLVTT